MFRYFIIHKPFGMLSQFSKEGDHSTLADLDFVFPKDVYPVGRLDSDSEGLLILTNDNKLNSRLLNPTQKHHRTYWAQVDGQCTPEAVSMLQNGVDINVNGSIYHTLPAKAILLDNEPEIEPRNPPIRYRKNIPTSWIQLSLHEGKNRQVRKMTAKVGFPTLRLIRVAIEQLSLKNIKNGQVLELSKDDLCFKLGIKL